MVYKAGNSCKNMEEREKTGLKIKKKYMYNFGNPMEKQSMCIERKCERTINMMSKNSQYTRVTRESGFKNFI